MESTPVELQPYLKAYEIRIKERDQEMWRNNIYTMHAIQAGVGSTIWGSKSKAKYPDKPLLHDSQQDKPIEEMTEAEIAETHQKELEKLDLLARTALGIKDDK